MCACTAHRVRNLCSSRSARLLSVSAAWDMSDAQIMVGCTPSGCGSRRQRSVYAPSFVEWLDRAVAQIDQRLDLLVFNIFVAENQDCSWRPREISLALLSDDNDFASLL